MTDPEKHIEKTVLADGWARIFFKGIKESLNKKAIIVPGGRVGIRVNSDMDARGWAPPFHRMYGLVMGDNGELVYEAHRIIGRGLTSKCGELACGTATYTPGENNILTVTSTDPDEAIERLQSIEYRLRFPEAHLGYIAEEDPVDGGQGLRSARGFYEAGHLFSDERLTAAVAQLAVQWKDLTPNPS